MRALPTNPIPHYKIGMACGYNGYIGRVIIEDIDDATLTNYDKIFDVLLIALPHGAIMKAGIFYVEKINAAAYKRLLGYEKDSLEKNGNVYANKLTQEKIKSVDELMNFYKD